MSKLLLQEHQRVYVARISLQGNQSMGGIGVAQHVRMNLDADLLADIADDTFDPLSIIGEGLSKLVEE
ncbi:hypothetical protein D3C75_1374530 [compost metagenome]